MSGVLIIDDEPNVCYSLRAAIETPTRPVMSVGSAREGIQSIRTNPPDAVVLDVRLPDMSGLQAYNLIRKIDARSSFNILAIDSSGYCRWQ